MPLSKFTRTAAEALRGPFAVECDVVWPDTYRVGGTVPGEDARDANSQDDRGRQDVRRRAIELLPETLVLLAAAESLMEDADDRGEFAGDDETARRGLALLRGAREVLRSINAAAAPHELEPVDAPPEEFRAWLVEKGPYAPAGMLLSPSLNPVALFLEQKYGGEVRVEDGVVTLPGDAGRRWTLPYMDTLLWLLGRTHHNLVGGPGALRALDEVLAGLHDGGQAPLPL